jgi:hypothetical protein
MHNVVQKELKIVPEFRMSIFLIFGDLTLTKDGSKIYLAMRFICVCVYFDIWLIVVFYWVLAPWQRPLAETPVKPMCT